MLLAVHAKDVTDYCKRCSRCLLGKAGRNVHTSIGSMVAHCPLDIIAIDFTVLEPGLNRLENVLVIIDVYTKFTQAVATKDQTAKTVARNLVQEWFV